MTRTIRALTVVAIAIAISRAAHAAPCPTVGDFVADSASATMDAGWTGVFHDQAFVGWKFRFALASCAGSDLGSCGQCTIAGLAPNVGSSNQRCRGDNSIVCATDADCGSSAPCRFFAGPPIPLAVGGVSICIVSELTSRVTGTVDPDAGGVSATLPLNEGIHGGITRTQPCPQCVGDPTDNDGVKGGSCNGGARNGLTCDANATSPIEEFGATSFDCPPTTVPIAMLDLASKPVRIATGPQNATLSAASPNCRAPGHTTSKCECSSCDNSAATGCSSNADCGKTCAGGTNGNAPCTVASQCPGGACRGGTTCGGLRCFQGSNAGAPCSAGSQCPGGACTIPGTATQPNACEGGDLNCIGSAICTGGSNTAASCTVGSQCPGGTCQNEGTCATGPDEMFCSAPGNIIGCATDADCADAELTSCVGGTNANNVCTVVSECPGGVCATATCSTLKARACFLDKGVSGNSVSIDGSPDARVGATSQSSLGAVFCVGPTFNTGVNATFGLPGLARLSLPGTITYAVAATATATPTVAVTPAPTVTPTFTPPVVGKLTPTRTPTPTVTRTRTPQPPTRTPRPIHTADCNEILEKCDTFQNATDRCLCRNRFCRCTLEHGPRKCFPTHCP